MLFLSALYDVIPAAAGDGLGVPENGQQVLLRGGRALLLTDDDCQRAAGGEPLVRLVEHGVDRLLARVNGRTCPLL